MENLLRLLDKLESNLRKSKFFGISIVKFKENQLFINKIRQIIMDSYTPTEEVTKLRKELERKEKELNELKNNLVENEEIVKLAYQKAQQIENQAKEEALSLINDADKYVIKILSQFEEELKKIIANVQNSRKNLENEIQLENSKVGLKKAEVNQELKKVNIKIK